jgi:hypothetical protein
LDKYATHNGPLVYVSLARTRHHLTLWQVCIEFASHFVEKYALRTNDIVAMHVDLFVFIAALSNG